jgi:hypothetical protein
VSSTPAPSLETVDMTDPCALCAALRAVYYRVLAGLAETRIRFRNGEDEEDVMYGPADKDALKIELAKQEALCAAKTTPRPPRFCFTAG